LLFGEKKDAMVNSAESAPTGPAILRFLHNRASSVATGRFFLDADNAADGGEEPNVAESMHYPFKAVKTKDGRKLWTR
jgi:hypothetical protein